MGSNVSLIAFLGVATFVLSVMAAGALFRKSPFTPHLAVSSGLIGLVFFSSLPPRFSSALIAAGFAFVAGFLLLLRGQDRPAEPEKHPESNIVRVLPPESYLSETGSWRLRRPEEYLSRSGVWRLKS